MNALQQYIAENCTSHPRGTSEANIDMVFFEVECNPAADPSIFRQLASEHKGEFNQVDVFDGKEHGYMELGGWLGNQLSALQFQALGAKLNCWKLLTPQSVLRENCTPDLEKMLAGQGLISIVVPNSSITD